MIKKLIVALLLISSMDAMAQTIDMSLIPYRKGDKWGYATVDKEIVIRPQFNEAGWLEAQDQWPTRSNNFFKEMDEDRDSDSDFDGSILLSRLLDNARKIRLKYYGDGETKKPILFNPPFRRNKEVLPK